MPISSLEGKVILWLSEGGVARLDFVQQILPGGFVFMTEVVPNDAEKVEGQYYSPHRSAPVSKVWHFADIIRSNHWVFSDTRDAWPEYLLLGNIEEAA